MSIGRPTWTAVSSPYAGREGERHSLDQLVELLRERSRGRALAWVIDKLDPLSPLIHYVVDRQKGTKPLGRKGDVAFLIKSNPKGEMLPPQYFYGRKTYDPTPPEQFVFTLDFDERNDRMTFDYDRIDIALLSGRVGVEELPKDLFLTRVGAIVIDATGPLTAEIIDALRIKTEEHKRESGSNARLCFLAGESLELTDLSSPGDFGLRLRSS